MSILNVKAGSVTVRVYCGASAGKMRYEVRDHFGGRGQTHRKRFSVRAEALAYAQERAVMMCNASTAKFRLSEPDAWEMEEAKRICGRIGKTVLQVMHEAEASWKIESKLRLSDAPPVSQVVAEFLAEKERQCLSAYHLRDLRQKLTRFADSFRLPVNCCRRQEIEEWLSGLGVGGRTSNNYRAALVGLFGFAKDRSYLPGDWTEIEAVKPISVLDPDPIVLSPPDLERLLAHATPPSFRALLAIGAFCGIRSEEISKLKWEDFDFAAGYVFLRRGIVKGNARSKRQRQVPIPDNLLDWLPAERPMGELVSPYKNPKVLAGMKTKLAVKLSIPWPKNSLRKSWISYQLALTQDAGKVARWAGNSPSIISSNYERLVTPAAAREWFAIRPQHAESKLVTAYFSQS